MSILDLVVGERELSKSFGVDLLCGLAFVCDRVLMEVFLNLVELVLESLHLLDRELSLSQHLWSIARIKLGRPTFDRELHAESDLSIDTSFSYVPIICGSSLLSVSRSSLSVALHTSIRASSSVMRCLGWLSFPLSTDSCH